jgi:phage terminase small subunit
MSKDLVNRPLTEKQKQFVKIWVESAGQLSKTECAIMAGYNKESAYQRAYEMTNPKICPHVFQAIGTYKSEYQEKYQVTPENHIQILGKIRDKALEKEMYGVAGRMEELRGKTQGYYKEYNLNVNKNSIDDLSEEELDAKVKASLEQYSHLFEYDIPETKELTHEQKRAIEEEEKENC